MLSFTVFVFGLAIGSFLNALIHRLEKGESVLRGRSYCPHCKHLLEWRDLIPLVSLVVLQGRCRYCNERISFQYPLVELATGLVFLLIFWHLSLGFDWSLVRLAYLWTTASLLVVIFLYDLKHYIIPDKILFPAIGLIFLWRTFEQFEFGILNLFRISDFGFWISLPLVQAVVTGIGASFFFFAIHVLSGGRAMGFGDVKLAFLLGLFVGWPFILVSLAFAFSLGAASGLVLIALKKKGLKSEVPFAPFLIMGSAITFFFGPALLDWYFKLFLV